jgi:hypothetical protein
MNTSIIIPIHEYNDEISQLLNNAVESVTKQEKIDNFPEIFIVCSSSIKNNIVKFQESMQRKHQDNLKINLIENNGEVDFQSQVNLGVSKVKTKYFSILEFDDEYSTTYFYNVEKYIKTYPDIDIFLSMIVEVNEKNQAMKITNEIVWAQQFVGENGEMGYLNLNAIKQNTDFKISGAVINKEEFENLGGLKKNIKLTFNYEFLLRALNNACKIYTIPKIGYKHLITRKDSLFDVYSKTMSMEERKFWFETANKEANFTNDRIIDTSNLNQKNVKQK